MKVSLNCQNQSSSANTTSSKKEKLQMLLEEVLTQKGFNNKLNSAWLDNNTLDTDSIPPLALHSFLLKAENMGIGFTTERKVTVTFS